MNILIEKHYYTTMNMFLSLVPWSVWSKDGFGSVTGKHVVQLKYVTPVL